MSEEWINPREIAGECVRRIRTRRVDGYEIYLAQTTSTSVEVRDGGLESFKRAQSVGIALRILKDQKLGFSYLSIPDAPEITFELKDDGQAPDQAAGDGVWSIQVDVPFQAPPGEYLLHLTARDADGRVVAVRNEQGEAVPLTIPLTVVIRGPQE